ncbi:MAG: leucine-rich repeat protein, partial [Candidatus Hydrogenedentes bacterium]|nr:leucine-rich repeat protein [Candidatus Hydrogenedentota bacterium]
MRTRLLNLPKGVIFFCICGLASFSAEAYSPASDFSYFNSGTAIYIQGYGGAGGDVDIPPFIENKPVVSIQRTGYDFFYANTTLTSITIPDGVLCAYPDFMFNNCTGLTNAVLGNGFTFIGNNMFLGCSSLVHVILGEDTTALNNFSFYQCANLQGVYFKGNAPSSVADYTFYKVTPTVYRVAGTTGWEALLGDRPTAVWTCTATFDACDGVASYTTQVCNVGNAYGVLPTADRDGYTFEGWWTEPDGEGTEVTTDTLVPFVVTGHTVYANWAESLYSPVDDFLYSVDGNEVTITGYTGMGGDVSIPPVIENETVTKIGTRAFADNNALTNVIVGFGLADIGQAAFSNCANLVSVIFPDSVTNIGDYSFHSCSSLSNLYFKGDAPAVQGLSAFSSTVTIINYISETSGWGSTFGGCSTVVWTTTAFFDAAGGTASFSTREYHVGHVYGELPIAANNSEYRFLGWQTEPGGGGEEVATNTVVPLLTADHTLYALWTIFAAASDFEYTVNAGEVEITEYIGSGGSVLIPPSIDGFPVTRVGDQAFEYCTSLTNVVIGPNVEEIGYYAFSYCSNLTNVTFSMSTTDIGYCAFFECDSLKDILISDNVQSIDTQAFSGTPLTNIVVAVSNTVYSSSDGVLFNKTQTSLLQYPKGRIDAAYTIPSGVTIIGQGAFSGCGLTVVTIPEGVISIEDHGFGGCDSLKNVSLPDSLTSLGGFSFAYCDGMTNITFGSGLVSIGVSAFQYSDGLRDVFIPAGVTTIGIRGFGRCGGMTNIAVAASNPSFSDIDGVLFDKSKTCLLQCPAGKSGSYEIPENIAVVGYEAFNGCINLIHVGMPDSVGNLEYGAFLFCTGLQRIIIGDGVRNISRNAYLSCRGVTNLIVSGGVTNISNMAFSDCPALEKVFFIGDAPASDGGSGDPMPATLPDVFYVAGTTGWGAAYGGCPTAVWTSTATFDAGAGTPSSASDTYNVGNAYGTLPTATLADNTFGGWWT